MSAVTTTRCAVFDRILCPVDGSYASLDAVRQAAVLRASLVSVNLVGFVQVDDADYSVYGVAQTVSKAEVIAGRHLVEARALCPGASTELLHGPRVERMLELIANRNATLLAVGGSSRSRSIGWMRRDVSTEMLHLAPTSVLVARPGSRPGLFPASVAVGYDGTADAEAALGAARDVADRLGASLSAIVASDASQVESGSLADITVKRDERDPVTALVDASTQTDLLVLGSRGLRGMRSLGSVSERVGHKAASSVLVVRGSEIDSGVGS